MSKTLAELQASADTGRPQATFPICVAGKLVAELGEADRLLFEAESKLGVAVAELNASQEKDQAAAEGAGPPKRLGSVSQSPDLRAAADEAEAVADAAAAAADAVRARMEDHTVVLTVRGVEPAEWYSWTTLNPARDRDDDRPGHLRDQKLAGGFCNIDSLISSLDRFITSYGNEPASEAWWEMVRSNAAPGDLTRLASTVVGLHEQAVDLGKSRTGWRADRKSSSVSE